MPLRAFRMTLTPGHADEYQRRHDEIWPELQQALHAAGVEEYRIFLDPYSHHLFALMWLNEQHNADALPELPVMQRWWAYMADIMDTGRDNVPTTVPLQEVFGFMPGGEPCK